MRARLFALLILLTGCSNLPGSDIFSLPEDTTQHTDSVAHVDGGTIDLSTPDTVAPFDTFPELPPTDTPFVPGCEPGEGCFLDPCNDNADCQSGWCVEHLGEGVCSQLCQEECPPGWACKPVDAGGPDLAYVCVSQYSNLCKPCATSEGCKSPGGAEDACLSYGGEGSFCGGGCVADADCPWGFSCTDAETVDGVQLKQCTADAGVCPCAAKSVALGLATPCEVSNDFGTCDGKRICAEEGLGGCDAAVPDVETCDGLDNDCDGEVDEPVLVDSEYVAVCDDGNACTKDTCNGADGCTHEPLDEGECADGDACTVGDHCEAGLCVGSPVACDDDNPCTDDVCDGLGGCEFLPNAGECDDGNPCTVADVCKSTECVGTPVDCACQENADCGALEDGNLCNGTLYCDQSTFPYQCKVADESIIICPEPGDGPDAFCQQSECHPVTGDCSIIPAHDGFACDDGDACTVGDTCEQGECVPGVAPICADNNPCTDDSCHAQEGCQFVANTQPCNDGDACTTSDQCAEGQCVGGPALDCDDGNPCTDDACDPLKGCSYVANDAQCDDGDACTVGDLCKLGACLPGPPADCDDENQCTKDMCLKESGCFSTFIEGPCDDGNGCTVGEECINGKCMNGQPVDCSDGNPCTDDACVEDGCVNTPNQAPCDDGNACTDGDTCTEGACVATGDVDCDDGNLCTNDACDPEAGCTYKMNSLLCDDGNACTVGDQCTAGECLSNQWVDCDDGNPCTDDSCDEEVGCLHEDNTLPCDDNNACTIGDKCSEGACTYAGLTDCDDENVCTDDVCDPKLGCIHLHNSAPCEDGSICTYFDVCEQGVCVGGKSVECDDDNLCTDDSCDAELGCQFLPNQDSCSDGSVCTVDDVCNGGVCEAGASLDCDDENVCTDDSCDAIDGCKHAANDGQCDDENACTADTCDAVDGCIYTPIDASCDDSNACTEDSCDVDTGCVNTPIDDSCNDNIDCTVDTCDADTGCVYTPNNTLCDDEIDCTVDICDAELGCVHLPNDTLCSDDNACTDDVCSAETGCSNTNNSAPCDDGVACTENDTCSGGTCTGTNPKVKVYDSDMGVVTMLSCGGGHDGFNFVCNYKGYGKATGVHPTGDYQGGGYCWAVGEADGRINEKYSGCGGGCTHWLYIECYKCK